MIGSEKKGLEKKSRALVEPGKAQLSQKKEEEKERGLSWLGGRGKKKKRGGKRPFVLPSQATKNFFQKRRRGKGRGGGEDGPFRQPRGKKKGAKERG